MALQPIVGQLPLTTLQWWGPSTNVSTATIDAAGESVAGIGRIVLEGRTGSKTISAAGGGSIIVRVNTFTFANAGTNFRIGIQDVASTGLEDTTYDVRADLTGGGGGLTASALNNIVMTTGTKTITHGDYVAVVIELTTRAGVDTVGISRSSVPFPNATMLAPWGSLDNGSLAKTANPLPVTIVFDDGSLGWFEFLPLGYNWVSAFPVNSINSGTTPDEICAVFSLPFSGHIDLVGMYLASLFTTDTFEYVLYADPLGTPSVIQTITVDPAMSAGNSATQQAFMEQLTTPLSFTAGVKYGFSYRPTSAGTINSSYVDLTTGLDMLKRVTPFSTIQIASRSDQTGAFTEIQPYYMPLIFLNLSQLDDSVSGGSVGIIGG